MTPSEAARTFSQYAKAYHAGAFATPMNKELEAAQAAGLLHQMNGCLVLEAPPTGKHGFNDFTGAKLSLPAGCRIARHVAVTSKDVPSLRQFQVVYAYMEDKTLTSALKAQEFHVSAVKVSAASEIIGLWTAVPRSYPAHDLATMAEVPVTVPQALRKRILKEVEAVSGWKDDDPYYHKGEWSHVSLRGYKPDDPNWGVKPSEMSRNWWLEHPEARKLAAKPDWTVLTKHTPALMELIRSVNWWEQFDRVRLLRLATGQLKRHTDITDREAGTRDGQLCRFHLPLVTDPSVRAVAWDLLGNKTEMHWAAWHLYYLDQRKPHAALNPSNVTRIHLVVDVVASDEVRAQLAA